MNKFTHTKLFSKRVKPNLKRYLILLIPLLYINAMHGQICPPGWEQNTFSWTDEFNAYQFGGTATATATYSSAPAAGDFEVEELMETNVNPNMWANSGTYFPAFDNATPDEGGYLAYLMSGNNAGSSSRVITYDVSEPMTDPHFYIGSTGIEPWTTLDFSGTVGLTSIDILDETKLVESGLVLSNPTSNEDQPQGQGVVRLNGTFSQIVINIVNLGPPSGSTFGPADRFRFAFGQCVAPAVPEISTVKSIINTEPSATVGATDVTFEITFVNTGNIWLEDIQLTDDLDAQLGCTFQGIVGSPTITASTATTVPGLNGGFNGDSNVNIFNGNSTVQSGCAGAPNPLTNQAIASGSGVDAGGNATGGSVSDPSDSGTDPNGPNPGEPGDTGGTDDPVEFTVFNPVINLEKTTLKYFCSTQCCTNDYSFYCNH